MIIPNYNRRHLLPETLGSVFHQDFSDYEVICVDDGSTDGSLDYLSKVSHPIITLSGPNRGPGSARNRGAEKAQGEYLAFLDSDDIWLPWNLSILADLIQEHNSPAILSGCIKPFLNRKELPRRAPPLHSAYYSDYLVGGVQGHFVGSCMAVLRRDLFLKAGGFIVERINAEDHDLALRMGTDTGFVQVLSPPTVGWRQHSSNATRDLQKSFDGLQYLIEQEQRGMYPGGASRARDRRQVITGHVRPAALSCLKHGMATEAWSLYRETFVWHLLIGRWKFLFGFPAKASVTGWPRKIRSFAEALFLRSRRGVASRLQLRFYRLIGLKAGKQN